MMSDRYIATDMNIDTRTNADQTYYDSITTRIPAGHWGEPKDFKGPAVFLASEASSYITGETIVVCINAPVASWYLTNMTRSMEVGWRDEVDTRHRNIHQYNVRI